MEIAIDNVLPGFPPIPWEGRVHSRNPRMSWFWRHLSGKSLWSPGWGESGPPGAHSKICSLWSVADSLAATAEPGEEFWERIWAHPSLSQSTQKEWCANGAELAKVILDLHWAPPVQETPLVLLWTPPHLHWAPSSVGSFSQQLDQTLLSWKMLL